MMQDSMPGEQASRKYPALIDTLTSTVTKTLQRPLTWTEGNIIALLADSLETDTQFLENWKAGELSRSTQPSEAPQKLRTKPTYGYDADKWGGSRYCGEPSCLICNWKDTT